ncbi:PAS domain S-box protein [Mucilaginibacter ginkgonis]|uniref:histidine kinase n=1 Tax=Mucilaginibacter ginkgonis TaxID=2682091 RepID=A0A6I4HXV8_9SPHI|nr:PAS domain S-box protein [Mucilaginibacter ginkgonis]QQL49498.1 PAS domain S-box protein [Mucilaginibacter ginkgonis]
MPAAPIPENEQERLAALHSYHILDSMEEKDFDELTELASVICGTPIALISLVDKDRQWFKSHKGLSETETAREYSFCAHAINSPNDLLIVENPKEDPRFADNPLVTGPTNINFYAGIPLVDDDGFALGSLCVIDQERKKLTDQQINALRMLGWQVIDKLRLRRQNAELQVMNEQLKDAQQKVNILNAILTESENRLKTFIDQSPAATIVFRGSNLLIEVANQPMLQLLGKSADIIGKSLLTAMPELEGQAAYDMLVEIYQTGKPVYGYDTPVTLVRNGVEENGFYDFTYTPIIEDGKVTGIIDIAVDVTEQVLARKKAEQLNADLQTANDDLAAKNEELALANHELDVSRGNREQLYSQLQENEEAQRLTVEAAHIGTWQIDPETKALTYNKILADIFGYKGATLMTYDQAIAQVTEAHRELIVKEIEKAISDGGDYDITYQQQRFDNGRIIWLRSMGKIMPDTQGLYNVFRGVVMDVTPQMEAQNNILESEERFRTMAEGSKILIAVSDETSKANYFSKAWTDMTGRPLADLIEFGWTDLLHPEDRNRYLKIYLDAFRDKIEFNGDFRIRDKNGDYRWLLANGQPRFRPDGTFAGYIASCADITEQKDAERRKDDFISIASHELKTPITALKGAVQLLSRLKDKPDSPMLPKMIDQAAKSTNKVTTLIDDLLNATRMNEGQMTLNKTNFSVAELLDGCCTHVRLEGKYQLVFEGDRDLEVFADEQRVDQVIVNFVNNAVKYASESTEIFLKAEREGDHAKISVRDTGPGIPKEKLEHLFDRYYRADHTGSQYSGLGLGLYISAEIVKRHGGEIGVDSHLGQGSTFWFTLPLSASEKI